MIDCRHLTKRFGDFTAVDNVSFEARGGICALLGPNGAGKSTLLKMLTGLLAPDEGAVHICGLDISKDSLAVKRAIGVVPEDLGLFDSLTVREHLELCGPVYGLDRKQTRERMEALLRVLDLVNGANTFLDQCSHGMRKKTALAMALLHNPRVLFLDEPFEGIDPVSSKAMQDLLTTVSQRGATVFFVSHLLSLVDRLATHVMVIKGGKIVLDQPAAEISRPLEEIYFGLIGPAALEDDLSWLRSSPS
ncbi:MAG TPA: ABC transporter ATP-binding protein [Bryobacteraceae bacterium]|jgi:ABC-2 type transport system ATP-binding protein|nr:ABC transporter ATP-binding protein [Bryobacteraceae bacterium]